MVSTVCLFASEIGVTHEATASPSSRMVQARHCPSPQPYLVPVKWSSSRNTSSSGRSGSVVMVWDSPLTVRVIVASIYYHGRFSGGDVRTLKRPSSTTLHPVAVEKEAEIYPIAPCSA